MSQRQETATDRLVSIIQLIQLGRLTGKLIARRGEGLAQEEGFILFRKGQVTQAVAEQRRGSEAFNTLTAWSNCRFLFLPSESIDDPASGMRTTAPLPQPTSERNSGYLDSSARDRATPLPDTSSTDATTVPYRSQPLNAALSAFSDLGLSRVHRHLLLLIDGQRPVAELVRLTGRSASEINLLLRELEQADLVRLV